MSYLDERQQQYIKNYGLFVRAKKGYTLDQKQSGFVLSGSGKAAMEAYKRSGQNTWGPIKLEGGEKERKKKLFVGPRIVTGQGELVGECSFAPALAG